MRAIRFKLSVWLYWLWIKVTPECAWKSAMIEASYLALGFFAKRERDQ